MTNKSESGRRGRPSRAAIYERLHVQIAELRGRLGRLPSPIEAEGIWHGIWLEEAHYSTAIEGNKLVLKQVEALLAEGRAVGNRKLSEYLEVRGYATAADWVYGHAIQPGGWSDQAPVSLAADAPAVPLRLVRGGHDGPGERAQLDASEQELTGCRHRAYAYATNQKSRRGYAATVSAEWCGSGKPRPRLLRSST